MAFYRAKRASGGGGTDGAYGTTTDVEGANQTVTINTGLSQVNRFYVWYNGSKLTTSIRCEINFNRDVSATKYYTMENNGSGSGLYYEKDIGTATGNAYMASIDSINGGTVTLRTGTNANGAIKSAWWMACS